MEHRAERKGKRRTARSLVRPFILHRSFPDPKLSESAFLEMEDTVLTAHVAFLLYSQIRTTAARLFAPSG